MIAAPVSCGTEIPVVAEAGGVDDEEVGALCSDMAPWLDAVVSAGIDTGQQLRIAAGRGRAGIEDQEGLAVDPVLGHDQLNGEQGFVINAPRDHGRNRPIFQFGVFVPVATGVLAGTYEAVGKRTALGKRPAHVERGLLGVKHTDLCGQQALLRIERGLCDDVERAAGSASRREDGIRTLGDLDAVDDGFLDVVRIGRLEEIVHGASAVLGLEAADDQTILELDTAAFLHTCNVAGYVEHAIRREVVHHFTGDDRDGTRCIDERRAYAYGGNRIARAVTVVGAAGNSEGRQLNNFVIRCRCGSGWRSCRLC